MRKLLLFIAACTPLALQAQAVSTFEALTLSKPDTFYINTTPPIADRGFNDGDAHFQYSYDTSYGGYWASGFAYSNKTDSVTSGYLNQYSAKAGKGYKGSDKYVVHWQSYDRMNENIVLTGAAKGTTVAGFYITNNTYAYNSMRDGDAVAKKFGDTTGRRSAADWFMLTTYGYLNGTKKTANVKFYLADFRDTTNKANNYIVKNWRYVNLSSLGNVDSLSFTLTSSDTGSFGMNTPAYFCMDNFNMAEPVGINTIAQNVAKVYPNPAIDKLFIETTDAQIINATILDASGRLVAAQAIVVGKNELNTAALAPGVYFLKLEGAGNPASLRFVKQ